jgi:hypothetical protein
MKNKQLNRLILAFLLIGSFFLFLLPPFDPDLGWHLRCGQQIWQQGEICSQNTFSVLLANYQWYDARVLYHFLIFPFYKTLGLFGLSLFNGLLMLTTIFFWFSLSGKKEIKVLSLPFFLLLSWLVLGFGIRNQLLSLAFFFCLLKLIELANQGKRKWFLLSPLVMFLWANGHGGFVLGVFLLLAFLFEKTLWLITKQEQFNRYLPLLGTIILSFGATLLNPFGYQIYLEGWRHYSVVPLSRLIAEWVPPHPWFQIVIWLLLAISMGIIYQNRKKPLALFRILVLLALAYLALKARRDLAFFFFFAGYILSLVKVKVEKLKPFALLVSMSFFVFGFLFQLPRTLMIDSDWQRFCQSGKTKYPYQAIEFMKKQPEKGNIFNAYEWGGFLIWQLPEYKVFVDGRMPAWPTPSGKSPYTIYLETLQTRPGWQETLEKYKIDWLFIYPGTFMDLKIRDNPESFGWQEVYRDKKTVIYQKT